MTDVEKYHCDHSPGTPNKHLTIICETCLRALLARHDKLLEFVKSISEHFNFHETEKDFMKFYVQKEDEAFKLLEEIGKLE